MTDQTNHELLISPERLCKALDAELPEPMQIMLEQGSDDVHPQTLGILREHFGRIQEPVNITQLDLTWAQWYGYEYNHGSAYGNLDRSYFIPLMNMVWWILCENLPAYHPRHVTWQEDTTINDDVRLITGNLTIHGNLDLEVSTLIVLGDLVVHGSINLMWLPSLYVKGDLIVDGVIVDHPSCVLNVMGSIRAQALVLQSLACSGRVEAPICILGLEPRIGVVLFMDEVCALLFCEQVPRWSVCWSRNPVCAHNARVGNLSLSDAFCVFHEDHRLVYASLYDHLRISDANPMNLPNPERPEQGQNYTEYIEDIFRHLRTSLYGIGEHTLRLEDVLTEHAMQRFENMKNLIA